MVIPETLKIGGHVYKVELVDSEKINGNCGEINRSRNTILIRDDLPESQKLETVIHEVLHAINHNFTEERIEFLSNALFQVIVDNNLVKHD